MTMAAAGEGIPGTSVSSIRRIRDLGTMRDTTILVPRSGSGPGFPEARLKRSLIRPKDGGVKGGFTGAPRFGLWPA